MRGSTIRLERERLQLFSYLKTDVLFECQRQKIHISFFYFSTLIMFISVLVTFTKNIWDQNNIFGIIIENEVIVYSAPFSNQAIEQSVFYSGNKVKIHQKTNLWIEVSTFDGRKGWIRALDVRNLY